MDTETRTITSGCMTVTIGIENRDINVSLGQVCEVGYEPIYLMSSDGYYLISSNNEYLAVTE